MNPDPSSQDFFESKYAASADPWQFEKDAYETSRYDQTIQALDGRHFARAFEPGCSTGVLTSRLAPHCDALEAIDISPTAVEAARRRCRGTPHVRISHGRLPDGIPSGSFDLIVFSEIGYYFYPRVLDTVMQELLRRLQTGGIFIGVHWLGESADHKIGGDAVHDQIQRLPALSNTLSFRYEATGRERYRLDRWVRQ